MAVPTLALTVTRSFYAWEVRGRGWTVADYPVSLEPPYRPCFLFPGIGIEERRIIDDGKRPTLASRLVDAARSAFAKATVRETTPEFTEEEPYPATVPDQLSILRIDVPRDHDAVSEVTAQLIGALASAVLPVAFELIGSGGTVTLQIASAVEDCDRVMDYLTGYLPDVAVTPAEDALRGVQEHGDAAEVIDFGLAEEFFLPIVPGDAFRIDPFVPLVSALARAGDGESIVYQVVIERTRNPWARAIREALDDGEGGCLIEDAPWFLRAAAEKTDTPLFAVAVRVAAWARTTGRARDLIRGTEAFFRQFARPTGNELVPLQNDAIDSEKHVASVLGRGSYRTGMLLSSAELVGLIHMPDESVRHPALSRSAARTKEVPACARGHGLVLGMNVHRGVERTVTLDQESRFSHTWLIGGSGTGKSTLLARMVLDDIESGYGVAVLDPHGDLVDDIVARVPAERIRDVILFDPADTSHPICWNILQGSTEVERELLASDLVAIFRRFATSWGDTMTTVLGEAVLALLLHPEGGTLVDLKRFLLDDEYRKHRVATVADEHVRFFWEKEYPVIGARSIGPLLARLDTFLRSPMIRSIVGQRHGKLDLGAVMEKRQVLLVRLAKGQIGEENAFLLGSLIIAKLNQLALMRQAVPASARTPYFCYIDEVQHFVTPSMESLATEGRKYRFGLVLAHQTLAQLADSPRIESALLGNCHTRIVFRVGDGDARTLARGFSSFEETDLTGLGRGEAIVRFGSSTNDCNVRTTPLPAVDHDRGASRREEVVSATRARYGTPRDEIVAAPVAAQMPTVPVAGSESEVTAAGVIGPARTSLPEALRSSSRKSRPTPADAPTPGRGGGMHKYLQHLVKRLAEERGFRATLEAPAGAGQVDVRLEREGMTVGVEISVTTDADHEEANLRKCLDAGYARIIFISPERKRRERVTTTLATSLATAPVTIIGPEDITTALDALGAPSPVESVVRGYRVKVKRQVLDQRVAVTTRSAVAGVIAKSVARAVGGR